MHATAMLVLVIAVVTVSACVQQSPPMAMSAATIVCQSNGERKNCVLSNVLARTVIALSTRPVLQVVPGHVKTSVKPILPVVP